MTSAYVKYDPALFALERQQAFSSRLGEFMLGYSELGSPTVEAWAPIVGASFTWTQNYRADDQSATLIVDSDTATISMSAWDDVPSWLAPLDRVRASYDGTVFFLGTVDTARWDYTADPEAVRHGGSRRVDASATCVGTYAVALGQTVCWASLPAEPWITRIRRYVTVDGW